MEILNKIGNWFSRLSSRRRLGVFDTKSCDELWFGYFSPIGIFLSLSLLVLILFVFTLAIVAYTPVLEHLPGYRSNVVRSRESLVENILRLDSLERVIADVMIYNQNVALIMDGKRPLVRDMIDGDTLRMTKSIVEPNSADTLLRREMESDENFAMRMNLYRRVTSGDAVALISPAEGDLISSFDLSSQRFGVEIRTLPESRILAVSDGIVLHSSWSPSAGYSVEMIHSGNIITIYTNMSQSLVVKGQLIKDGEVIGFSPAVGDTERLFGFELWNSGKPSNPEEYILFN